jgi:GxxExxY protein
MENEFTIEIINNKSENEKEYIPEQFIEIINKIKKLSESVFIELGTGFSECIYHRALEVAFRNENIMYESKRIIPINYKNINVGYGESDIIVYNQNQTIIIELKAVTNSPREIEIAQVRTYMRSIENSDIGIIINFPQPGTKVAKENIDFKIVQKKIYKAI